MSRSITSGDFPQRDQPKALPFGGVIDDLPEGATVGGDGVGRTRLAPDHVKPSAADDAPLEVVPQYPGVAHKKR